jgi:hypothetical protein
MLLRRSFLLDLCGIRRPNQVSKLRPPSAYNPVMDSRRVTASLKIVIAAMTILCVVALAVHPAGISLVLVGLLFVSVLLWRLSLVPNDALPVTLESRRLPQTRALASRFQRPPPPLL